MCRDSRGVEVCPRDRLLLDGIQQLIDPGGSSEQRLDILLPLITRLVSESFDFYHVGIFFIDNADQACQPSVMVLYSSSCKWLYFSGRCG